MKLDFNSLKFKNWLYLMVFSVLILALLWALQVFFLRTYYTAMKAREINKMGKEIVKYYSSDMFEYKLKEYAFDHNISIVVFDKNGEALIVMDAFDSMGEGFPVRTPQPHRRPELSINDRADRLLRISPYGIGDLIDNLSKSGADTVYYTRGEKTKVMAVFGAVLDNGEREPYYLLINSPISPIDSTAAVLKNQLLIITVILFLLSLIAAQIITKKLSVPIIKLTKSAKELASGNLDVRFDKGGYTEINQLSEALTYAAKELSKLDEYRKDFMANVSHDLKTPLTIIKFYGEMIKDISGNDAEKRNSHCDLIIKEADRLTGLVNEVLDISKLQSNNMILAETNFDLSETVNEILSVFYALCEKEGYIFHSSIEEAVWVKGDEELIKRVIYNLIDNAVSYTGNDKLVSVSLKNIENKKVRFEVTDTGAGIPEDQIDNIWERYYKVTENHRRSFRGTGLGLTIVKGILSAHRASFGVVSVSGSGSTFWFELP